MQGVLNHLLEMLIDFAVWASLCQALYYSASSSTPYDLTDCLFNENRLFTREVKCREVKCSMEAHMMKCAKAHLQLGMI